MIDISNAEFKLIENSFYVKQMIYLIGYWDMEKNQPVQTNYYTSEEKEAEFLCSKLDDLFPLRVYSYTRKSLLGKW